ncbi:molybdate transport system permease protein [Robiginitalea myxolifaciens]|uniref:Molybdenum transport system permease n=1 Tax=Robiginitalea myxolifaciens TaxID=400055 RepID=A0A1I6FNG0_9FLAO|nr:molybdate ABC transporter permease subunit [Robiginitalea myxolifaciens]SFR31475.1 molybdate transport system permease protein [Robiginitalea myxolifaciens]
MNWEPLLLTLKLALTTTLVLLLVSLPLAAWLSKSRSPLKSVVDTLVSMPLVLPPTVIGFYFLIAFSPSNAFGQWLDEHLGIQLVFSFPGLVLASVLYSLPFMVHPIQAGLRSLPPSLAEASYILGKDRLTTFFRVLLPNIRPALFTGLVLSFAHTVGEFGVVLMIGGSIPGVSRVASIAIYEEVETMNYAAAHTYSLILFGLSFAILLSVNLINGGILKRYWR